MGRLTFPAVSPLEKTFLCFLIQEFQVEESLGKEFYGEPQDCTTLPIQETVDECLLLGFYIKGKLLVLTNP